MSGNAKFVLNVFINIIIFIATTEPLSVDFNLLIYVVFSAILALGTKLCFFRCSKPTTVRGGGVAGSLTHSMLITTFLLQFPPKSYQEPRNKTEFQA